MKNEDQISKKYILGIFIVILFRYRFTHMVQEPTCSVEYTSNMLFRIFFIVQPALDHIIPNARVERVYSYYVTINFANN